MRKLGEQIASLEPTVELHEASGLGHIGVLADVGCTQRVMDFLAA
jgi:hypothetical protein